MTRLGLLLLSDGRFPAGGYAHSGGLEAAVADGLGVAELAGFLRERLSAVTRPEAVLMLAAHAAARERDLDGLLLLEREADARSPSRPLRIASHRLGAQLLRAAATVWPDAAAVGSYRAASAATPRPVAFGVVAADVGLDRREAASVYLYDEAATLAAAAVRLLPLDSADSLRLLAEAAPALERLAEEAAACREPPQRIPSAFAPALELRSLAHAAREGRLFAT